MRSLDNQILKLLSNNDVTFFIPPYQRNYEWNEDMCEVMFRDIKKIADHENIQHFFGTIIYHAESVQLGQPSKYILIDGQQRLTTTMLFLLAVRDVIDNQELKNYVENKYLKNNNVKGDVEYKIKLKQVENDWDAYKNIILNNSITEEDKRSNVFKNYSFFKNKLSELNQEQIKSLIEKGLDNFNIVTIELEPTTKPWENPQEIFESMNSLGKPLSLADLVRNYLFLGKTSSEQDFMYKNYWLKIEKNLSTEDNTFSVSSFIRDYMQLIDMRSYKKATDVNHKELYKDFKELFKNKDHEELVKDLSKYSEEYAILIGRTSGNKEIDKLIEDLKIIESSGFYSFILGVLNLREENKISDKECLEILRAIFIYVARRRIMRITQGENRNAPILVNYFEELINSKDKNIEMFKLLSNQQYALRLPNDNEIELSLLSQESNFYNLRSGKFIQSLIEEKITKNRPNLDEKKLQVEHIMPQTLNKEWEYELGVNYKEIHNNYLNNIGNLTLIRHNQELSNDSFKDKKEVYENNAGMQIAKNKIIEKEKWGEEEIKDRAKYLVNILLNEVLEIPEEFKFENNFSTEKKNSNNRLSLENLGLIGKEIYLLENSNIKAKVINDKEVLFEGKEYRLAPLTKLCMERMNKGNKSGAFRGGNYWGFDNKKLIDLTNIKAEEKEIDDME